MVKSAKNDIFTVVWIGSPSTSEYLYEILEILKEINKTEKIAVRIIGSKLNYKKYNFEFIEWSKNNDIELISECHVGIMPLPDNKWTKGKCAFKLIQYHGCKLPVIGSPVGANLDIIEENKNGFFAKDKNDWIKYILYLKNQPAIAYELGNNGFEKVKEKYSSQKWKKTYIDLINSINL